MNRLINKLKKFVISVKAEVHLKSPYYPAYTKIESVIFNRFKFTLEEFKVELLIDYKNENVRIDPEDRIYENFSPDEIIIYRTPSWNDAAYNLFREE